jgi:Short C-terminal domain
MPGLIRGVARTAVVAGTATAVSNRVSRRQAGRWSDQEQQAYEQQQASQQPPPPPAAYPPQYQQPAYQEPPPPPPAPAPAPVQAPPADVDMDSKLLQLRQLGELKTQGILSDAEFEAQKAKILGT